MMTSKEIDVVFEITAMIHNDKWFKKKSLEEVQAWVAEQLAKSTENYTVPCGASWAVLTSKEKYDEYKKQ